MSKSQLVLLELRELLSQDQYQLRTVAKLYARCWKGVLEREFGTINPEKVLERVEEQFQNRNKIFPEGELVVFDQHLHKPKGVISALRRNFSSPSEINEGYAQLTGNGNFTTHEKEGNTLLCVAVNVHPEYQTNGLSKFLIQAELELADRLGIEYRIAFSRAEGLRRFYDEFERERIPSRYQGIDRELLFYLDQIKITKPLEVGEKRRVFDWSLSIHLKNRAHPVLNKEEKVRFICNSRPADLAGGGYNIPMQYNRDVKIVDLAELARIN